MEVRAACEVAAVNDRADVGPFRIHRTGGVNDKGQFDLSTASVIPSDLNVIVGINDNIWVPLVANDGCEEGVIKESDGCTRTDVGLNHGVVDLRLVEETPQFVVVVLPNDVNVVLTVDIERGPVSVLGPPRDDGVIDGRNGAVVRCHAVHWSGPWRECRVHDGVLTCFVGPYDVDAVVFVDGEIRVPNLVESRIGDLGGIDQCLATGRHHRVVEVEVVTSPYHVNVSGAVRANRCLRIGRCTPVHDLDGFGDYDGVCTHGNGGEQQGRHHG